VAAAVAVNDATRRYIRATYICLREREIQLISTTRRDKRLACNYYHYLFTVAEIDNLCAALLESEVVVFADVEYRLFIGNTCAFSTDVTHYTNLVVNYLIRLRLDSAYIEHDNG